MARPDPHPDEQQVLWRVVSFGDEVHHPSEGWHHDNQHRGPAGLAVFQYALAGEMVYRDRTGIHRIGPGSAALFQHGESSIYGLPSDFGQRYRTQWISLRGAGLNDHVAAIRGEFGSVFRFGRDHAVRDAMRRLMALSDPRNPCDPLVMADEVHGFVMRLLLHARQARHQRLSPVERAIDDLLRFPVTAWSLKELAQRHGVSREHITRVFTERQGRSPAGYLAAKRFKRAMELLEQTSLPLAAVARQAGYGTAHAMARHVKRQTGRPPSQCRRPADRPGDRRR